MLKQLLKYEFKATSRVYGGLYLALALLSVVLGLSVRGQTVLPSNSKVWQFVVILSIVYAAVVAAIAVLCLVTTIQRFTQNLLGREGYLMHTLPVTETQLILSKLLTSMVWVIGSIALGVLCITVMVGIGAFEPQTFGITDWNSWMMQLKDACSRLSAGLGANFGTILFWTVCINLARLASVILCIYTACMIAHQFKNHTLAAGILGFIGLNFVENQIDQLLGIDSVNMFVDVSYQVVGIHVDRGWSIAQRLVAFGPNVYYLSCFVFTAAIAAAYFFLTRWLMKNKLNLE